MKKNRKKKVNIAFIGKERKDNGAEAESDEDKGNQETKTKGRH